MVYSQLQTIQAEHGEHWERLVALRPDEVTRLLQRGWGIRTEWMA